MIEPGRDKRRIVEGLNPELEVPFGRREYEERRARVRELMREQGVDTLYVSDPDSLNYLCGYKALWYQAYGHSGWGPVGGLALSATSDTAMLFDTEKERVLGGYSTLGVEFHLLRRYEKPMIEFIIDDLTAAGWLEGTVGLERGSYRPFPSLSVAFTEILERAGAQVVDATEIVRAARRAKSPSERMQIRTAARLADQALERGLELLRPGVAENVVYGEMYRAMLAAGGDIPAITPMIRSGARTAVRFASPARRTIVAGDLVTLSAYGCYNRYHSFASRSAIVGRGDEAVAEELQDIAAEVSRTISRTAAEGGSGSGFVKAAEDAFGPRLTLAHGHALGVGLPPDPVGDRYFSNLTPASDEPFPRGEVLALEISVMIPELGGCVTVGDTVTIGSEEPRLHGQLSADVMTVAS